MDNEFLILMGRGRELVGGREGRRRWIFPVFFPFLIKADLKIGRAFSPLGEKGILARRTEFRSSR